MGSLTDDQVRSAADMLVALREGSVVLAGLPAEVTPDNTADIQRIIDAVSDRVDRPIRGWKTYTVYKPMNPPFSAPVYDLFPSGAEIPAEISPGGSSSPRSCSGSIGIYPPVTAGTASPRSWNR